MEGDLQALHTQARKVLNNHRDELMGKANVVGIGVGYAPVKGEDSREIAIVVMVAQKLPKSRLKEEDLLPSELEGIPVDVREVGRLEAKG